MPLPAPSMNSESVELLGSTVPRLWTPPLRELTPDTSYGFDVTWFAEHVLGTPLDPWQEWLVIHAGELLPDRRPRFRVVLAMVGRQNGKSTLLQIMTLYWLYVERQALTLGMSTSRDLAKESWRKVVDIAQDNPLLAAEIPPNGVRLQIGEETLRTVHGSQYRFAATNRRAGRGLTINRLIVDELREHDDWEAWDAASNATNAVFDAQTFCITNQGDECAVVLDALREPAVEYIETGQGDARLGLFEYSAPPGSEPDEPAAICAANPNAGRRLDLEALIATARRAKRAGGAELAGFRTEILCQRVHLLDPAVDPDLWNDAGTDTPINLADHRDKVVLALDVSLDGSHATLCAAAVVDSKVHVEVVKAWDNAADIRRDLGDVAEQVRARRFGWLPGGPAAAITPDLKPRRGTWPPRGTELVEIKSDVTAVCMGLAEQVAAGAVVHPRDPLLDAHIRNAQRLRRGDAWVFGRRGAGAVDGAYAAAAAVHLARTLPPPKPALAVV